MRKSTVRFKVLTGTFGVLLLIVFLAMFLNIKRIDQKWSNISTDVYVTEFTLNGYSRVDDLYINTIGDANLQLPLLEQYVENINIIFAAPLKQGLDITVYYAEDTHGYSENYTSSIRAEANTTEAHLSVGAEITTCRIDIGTKVDEDFELSSIILNNSESRRLETFRTVVLYLLAAFFIAALYILVVVRPSMEKIFAVIIFSLGMFYMFVITPLSPPDETHHYQSAYQLSNFMLLQGNNNDYGNSADFDYTQFVGHCNVASGYLRVLEDAGLADVEGEMIEIPRPRDLSYFIEYLAPAMGIALARILNLNFVCMFLLGRLMNLSFFTACVYLAVKRIPRFKLVLGLLAMFPITLQQAASYSYDAFINGIAFLLIASLFKAIWEEGSLSRKDYLYIFICSVLLAPAKIVYTVISLLIWFIPRKRFSSKKDKIICCGLLMIACVGVIVLFQLPSVLRLAEPHTELNWEGGVNYSFGFVLENPVQTVKIFLRTLKESGNWYFFTAVGSLLSGLSLPISNAIIWGFVVIVLVALSQEERMVMSFPLQGGCWIIVASIIGLTMASMFLGWTSNTRSTILGVQGRYFIPVEPLVCIGLSQYISAENKNYGKYLLIPYLGLECATIISIINYTLAH